MEFARIVLSKSGREIRNWFEGGVELVFNRCFSKINIGRCQVIKGLVWSNMVIEVDTVKQKEFKKNSWILE